MRLTPRALRFSALAVFWALGGCGPPPLPDFPSFEVSPPDPDDVGEVLFLVGDAGKAIEGRSPILLDLSQRIEWWSERIGRDSSVSVIFLGDIVYPVGVRDRDHPAFPDDSTHLWAQINLVSGEHAQRRGSLGLFLTGNHDWGNTTGDAGIQRVLNLDEQIELARAQGIRVDLVPDPGLPGPEVIDLRRNTRLIAVDTHWFLQERSERAKNEFLERVLVAVREADGRRIVFAAHHPFASAGRHGELVIAGEAMGLGFLLRRSGTLVQDLNSPVYLDLNARLRTAFTAADQAPLVWAGGHDHSLQVIEAQNEFEPKFQLVSGSASKRTRIREIPELKWGTNESGYMILFLLRDGSVRLFVISTDSDTLVCPESPEEERLECLQNEASRFQYRYSELLAPASSEESEDP